MVKTYQLGNMGPYGASLKVAPVTTENEVNAKTCLQVNGSSEASINPQSILPSLIGFECIGKFYLLCVSIRQEGTKTWSDGPPDQI